MAYDFVKERFNLCLPRNGRSTIPEPTLQVAEALWKHKVKLSATLARMRVKENAASVTQLLPAEERRVCERVCNQPYFARVKLSGGANAESLITRLCDEGYHTVSGVDQFGTHTTQKAVCLLKRDLLAFSPPCREVLHDNPLVKEGHLVLQVQMLNRNLGVLFVI